jgi:hypothetical protein
VCGRSTRDLNWMLGDGPGQFLSWCDLSKDVCDACVVLSDVCVCESTHHEPQKARACSCTCFGELCSCFDYEICVSDLFFALEGGIEPAGEAVRSCKNDVCV